MAQAPLPLSCYVIAHNEADRITRALRSVRDLCAEIVLVDSGSADKTRQIAERFGARVIHRDWTGSFGEQKRFAEDQCRHDWLLNLDADEWLSAELAQEIRALFEKGEPNRSVWRMPIQDAFFGESEPRRSRRPWHKNSLYDRRRARMTRREDHAGVPSPREGCGRMKHPILHAPARSLSHLVAKEMRYARDAAKNPKGRAVLLVRILTEFPLQFARTYLLHGDCRFGRKGYIHAMTRAFGRFLRIAEMLEARQGWQSALAPAPVKPEAAPQGETVPLSCFIIAQDEADRIGRALRSVHGLCAEIVVVDSGSADETPAIAERFGARVIHQDWLGGYGAQKRFGQDRCAHDHILNLDADEWLSAELAEEIRATLRDGTPKATAWTMPRYEIFPGSSKPWRFAKAWNLIRFHHRSLRWSDDIVGDHVAGADPDKTERLRGRLLHAPIRSLDHLAKKENRYTSIEAHIPKSLTALRLRLLTEFPLIFLKLMLLRRNLFGGVQGFVLAMIYSFSRFLRIAKKLERQTGSAKER